MIKGVAHTAFTVKDMERSLEFYCDKLGLKKAFEIHDNDDQPWIVYLHVSKDQFLELFYGGSERAEWTSNIIGFNHICLAVDDIFEIAEKLRNEGVTIDAEPSQGKDFNLQCW
ncbi:MAG: VOC family protein, partial [Ruminiclostridium sp.]